MKTELVELSPTQKEIKIEIGAETVKEVYNKVSQKYARAATVPGFRKGLAPVDVIRLRYKDEIQSEVLQDLLSKRVTEAIQEYDLHPLSEPELHLDNSENLKLNGSQPVSLHIHVEVMPEIPVPEYKGLEVTRRVRPLLDGEVDGLIDERRQQYVTLLPVEDRPAEEGDTVIVDLEGVFADEPDAEPIKADDLEIKLGDEAIEKSFTENLNGVREDEEKEFTVSYPSDFTSPALAGKTLHYKAKVKSVGRLELPELDDEWAKSLDEGYESLADLREKLQEDMNTVSKSDADARVRNDLIAKLIEGNEFEVPNALIDVQARNLLNNFAQDMSQRGVDLNKIDKEFVQMAYTQMRSQAERDVRGAMLLEKIADEENVEISDEEIAGEIERMAEYYGVSSEDIRESLKQQEGGEANIANNLRTRKAVEALVSSANITEGEWIPENQLPQPDTSAIEPADETESEVEAEPADESEPETETQPEEEKPEEEESKQETES